MDNSSRVIVQIRASRSGPPCAVRLSLAHERRLWPRCSVGEAVGVACGSLAEHDPALVQLVCPPAEECRVEDPRLRNVERMLRWRANRTEAAYERTVTAPSQRPTAPRE
ncbi:hypothetical protein [Halosegnis longus]|uniref:Uncharacterized protein n=1 Tax=Halosegnis longus TaxID=2216012 RepID=A0AAJ4R9S5_9EURY|nr:MULTISPECIES: hypothetical protein [Halobacteriales]RNJ26817.1 hypothetical protein Nmn1133_09090 [Salella cibi]